MEHVTCLWFYFSIFRIQYRGRGRGQVASRSRNERLCRYCSSTHVRTNKDHYDRWSSMCIGISFRDLSFHFTFISYVFCLRLERLELDVSFSGHCARRKKWLVAEEARQTATKRVTTNGFSSSGSFSMIPQHGKSFSLLLRHCALLVFVVVFFLFSIIVHLRFGQIAFSLASVARNRLRVELELRKK